jgi:site-specific DNA recombinase
MDLHNNYADLYLRVSIDLSGKSTIDLQEADCRAWADKNGLTVRAVHVDRGRSGYREGVERRGFDAALTAVSSGIVATLLVWKLDRLSRQGIGQIGLVLRKFEEAGGRLVAVHDDLDTARPRDRQLITMLSELARSESENLGLRVRTAKTYLRSKGRWIGGAAPYGLSSKDGRLWPDPRTAPIVREIARRILSGCSLLEVTRWLNAEGIPAARGGRWGAGSVAQLMRGPATAGLLPETLKKNGRYTGTVVPWRDPETGETVSVMAPGESPLISPDDQLRILALFEERTTLSRYGKKRGAWSPGSRHLLTGLLRCAGCGERMSKQGNSYKCQTTRIGRLCPAPGGAYQQALDRAVVRRWMDRLTGASLEDPLLAVVAERWAAVQAPEIMAKRRAISGAIRDGEAALATLADDHYVRGLVDREGFLKVAEALTHRIDGLKERLDSTPSPTADVSGLLDAVTLQETWAAASTGERRDLLRLALAEVRVSQGVRGRRFDPAARLEFTWVSDRVDDGY